MKRRPLLKKLLPLLAIVLLSASACSNGKRVVLIDPRDTIIRIGPNVTGRIYHKTAAGQWELSRNKVAIPEGWYAGSID